MDHTIVLEEGRKRHAVACFFLFFPEHLSRNLFLIMSFLHCCSTQVYSVLTGSGAMACGLVSTCCPGAGQSCEKATVVSQEGHCFLSG